MKRQRPTTTAEVIAEARDLLDIMRASLEGRLLGEQLGRATQAQRDLVRRLLAEPAGAAPLLLPPVEGRRH
jgi:hypothetical protein